MLAVPVPRYCAADLHCDTAGLIARGFDLSQRHWRHHVDIPRMEQGGVRLQVFACFSHPRWWRKQHCAPALAQMSGLLHGLLRHDNKVEIIHNKDDLAAAKHKICALIGLEGGHHLDGSLGAIDTFHSRGMRVLTLTWNNSNFLGASCIDPSGKTQGLTAAGRDAVLKLEELGIAVDLGHAGEKTFWDTLDAAQKPPFVSHACSHALCPVPRNISDEQAKALSQKGGIIGVAFYQPFLRNKNWWQAGIRDVADHIMHFCATAAPESVALGADYDGMKLPAQGLADVSKLPALAEQLRVQGMPERDIENVFFNNAVAYFNKVLPPAE